jgi:acyl-CoA dehydrogenase
VSTSDAERAELRSAVRAYLEKVSPEARVRAVMDTSSGHDDEVWRGLADDLGVVGLTVREADGGAGAGWAEQAVVLGELGRSLACVPYLATVGLAVPALQQLALTGAEVGDRLAALAAGRSGTLALPELDRTGHTPFPRVTARHEAGRWVLDGTAPTVLDGAGAAELLIPAATPDGVGVFAADVDRAGLTVDAPATSDRTRRVADLTFASTPGNLLGRSLPGTALLDTVRHHALVALACEQVGAAEKVLADAVAYAKERQQFGRAIGSFQAVKHKLADMLVATETARSAAWAGVRALDAVTAEAPEDLALVASLAHVVCSESFAQVASEAVQVHGGIGYTWEHPAHLFVKRSRGAAVLFGTPARHRRIVGALAPLPPSQEEPV